MLAGPLQPAQAGGSQVTRVILSCAPLCPCFYSLVSVRSGHAAVGTCSLLWCQYRADLTRMTGQWRSGLQRRYMCPPCLSNSHPNVCWKTNAAQQMSVPAKGMPSTAHLRLMPASSHHLASRQACQHLRGCSCCTSTRPWAGAAAQPTTPDHLSCAWPSKAACTKACLQVQMPVNAGWRAKVSRHDHHK